MPASPLPWRSLLSPVLLELRQMIELEIVTAARAVESAVFQVHQIALDLGAYRIARRDVIPAWLVRYWGDTLSEIEFFEGWHVIPCDFSWP